MGQRQSFQQVVVEQLDIYMQKSEYSHRPYLVVLGWTTGTGRCESSQQRWQQ